MSLNDLFTADATSVFNNTSDFAETITRWPNGKKAQSESVTGVLLLDIPSIDTEVGEETVRRAEFQVLTTQTLNRNDVWIINSETWTTDRIGDPQDAFRPVYLKRNERIFTSGGHGGVR